MEIVTSKIVEKKAMVAMVAELSKLTPTALAHFQKAQKKTQNPRSVNRSMPTESGRTDKGASRSPARGLYLKKSSPG
jgi:hypothetical protein